MFNVSPKCSAFVSQKRMSVLRGIFGKQGEPGGYISPPVWVVGSLAGSSPLGRIQYGYMTHAKSVD